MKLHLLLLVSALGTVGCANGVKLVHTPPGTSVEVALARKAEAVRHPASPSPTKMTASAPRTRVPAVEPDLPAVDNTESVAEAYSRGMFYLQTGADTEAIAAFEEAVKIDPKFADAWQSLATVYERQGDEQHALEAFKRAKALAVQ